ncbi:MAG TPA: hypothetical protein VJQ56_02770 [Blastocatellia bacterium]|nr:hypothetical protein [Blastocatellia bacterium]
MYQRLLRGVAAYQELGRKIVEEIKAARAFRQADTVRDLSGILINIPVKEYQLIGQYYLVWCQYLESEFQTDHLERIIERTRTYKTKALTSRGTIEWYKGNNEAAMYFYNEALKTSPTISEYVDLSKAIAVIKSQEGFHGSALRDLENLIPIIRHAEPVVYCDVLNSYSVELSEAGRLQEAANVSKLAVNSPFGPYYCEWQETYSEVNQKLHKRRSMVAVSTPVTRPEPKAEPEPEPAPNLAKILKFPQPKAELYKGMRVPALTPIQWLAVMMKIKFGEFIPDADAEIDRFCDLYRDLVANFYE